MISQINRCANSVVADGETNDETDDGEDDEKDDDADALLLARLRLQTTTTRDVNKHKIHIKHFMKRTMHLFKTVPSNSYSEKYGIHCGSGFDLLENKLFVLFR